jgi:ARG/rhodanese/phosphatase superfamily protein
MRNFAVLAVVVVAACQNDRPPETEVVSIVKPSDTPAKPKPKVKEPPKVDLALAQGFEMRRPIKDGRLTLIPIVATHPDTLVETDYLTLEDGMARGLVSVREVSRDFEVDTVSLHNRSKLPLLVLEGELILDGEQDRVMQADRVVPPGASLQVNVRCVEHDRDYGGLVFRAGKAMAESSLRRTVAHESQENVWDQVNVINRRAKLSPSTSTYRHAAALQNAGANAARRNAIVEQLGKLEERAQMVGFAIAVDEQVIAVERFATPALYRQLETELLGSYVIATDGDAPRETKGVAPTDVRAFVASARAATTEASFVLLRPRRVILTTDGPRYTIE